MDFEDKTLYHQIHPAKLATDWGTTAISVYFLWRHRLLRGLVWMLVPPVIASFFIVRFVDLEPYKRSRAGHYIKRYMTPAMVTVRLTGLIPIVIGGWYHRRWLIPLGVVITLFGWFRGLLFPTHGSA